MKIGKAQKALGDTISMEKVKEKRELDKGRERR